MRIGMILQVLREMLFPREGMEITLIDLETGHFLFSRPARKFISQFFKQSSDVYVPSTTAEECLVQTPKLDSLKKYSSDPSTNVVKVWTDPTKAKDKGRRRVAEQWRREQEIRHFNQNQTSFRKYC
jgi:hypothetical protein